MAPSEGHRSVKAALATVAEALTAHGFAAHAESSGASLTIVSEHCPFGAAAQQYPHVVCAVDRGLIRGLMSGPVRRHAADLRGEPTRRRRPLRRPRLSTDSLVLHARVPRPRVVVSAAPGRARGDAPVPRGAPRRPGPAARRGPRHPGRGRGRARAGRRSCSAPGPARSCSPRAAPRRSTTRSGVACAGPGSAAGVVTTAVEHSSVLDACRREPGELTLVGVDRLGRFDPDEIAAAITDDTALVSVQLANHEVGHAAARRGGLRGGPRARACSSTSTRAPAAGHVPVDFAALGADLLSVTAHKLGGPKGAGALLIRRGPADPAADHRRRAGARAARRAGERARDRRASAPPRPSSIADDRLARRGRPRRGGSPTRSCAASIGDRPRRRAVRRSRRAGARTSSASASRASRPSRSCSRSTSTASRCTPARRARARRSSRRRCSRRWAPTRTARMRVSVGWSSTDADATQLARRAAGYRRARSAPFDRRERPPHPERH